MNGLKKHLLPVAEYQEPLEFTKKQLSIFWLPDEIHVEKDIHDVLVNFTESEKHGVITTLKLFSLYETHAGDEYWGKRYKEIFDGAEFHRMASVFSMFELAIHAPFYNKINELLHLDTPDFYLSYKDNPILKARMKHVGEMIADPDDLLSLAAFSMVEGVILYSSFAYLLHYQNNGKNKLLNVNRGLLFGVKDEHIHSIAGAWSFRHKLAKTPLTEPQKEALEERIRETARKIYEHEKEIISLVFEKGTVAGITALQLEHFVQSRVNLCLKQLGYAPEYEVKHNPIEAWFYKSINDYSFNDFFAGLGSQYNREWNETGFIWKGKEIV